MFNGAPLPVNGNTNAGQLAALFNTGTLVYPLTKAQFQSGSVARPPQLFSHSDQVTQWQTSIPDRPPTTGWGGRCADLMDTLNPHNGNTARPLARDLARRREHLRSRRRSFSNTRSAPTVSFRFHCPARPRPRDRRRSTACSAIDELQANLLVQNYAMALDHSLATGASLSTSLANSPLLASYFNVVRQFPEHRRPEWRPDVHLEPDGAAQDDRAHHRCRLSHRGAGRPRDEAADLLLPGGRLRHAHRANEQCRRAESNARQVRSSARRPTCSRSSARSMNAFQAAMHKIGVQYGDADFEKRVTAFTNSDFGRTFPSNDLGSDHGWGSHHIVMGGAVRRTAHLWQLARARRRRSRRHQHRPLDSDNLRRSIRGHAREMVRRHEHADEHRLSESEPVRGARSRVHELGDDGQSIDRRGRRRCRCAAGARGLANRRREANDRAISSIICRGSCQLPR